MRAMCIDAQNQMFSRVQQYSSIIDLYGCQISLIKYRMHKIYRNEIYIELWSNKILFWNFVIGSFNGEISRIARKRAAIN